MTLMRMQLVMLAALIASMAYGNLYTMRRKQFTFPAYTSTNYIYKVACDGEGGSHTYYAGMVSTPATSVVKKENSDGTTEWIKHYNIEMVFESFSFSSDSDILSFIGKSSTKLILILLDISDGARYLMKESPISTVQCNQAYCRTISQGIGPSVHYIMVDDGSSANLCIWTASDADFNCYVMSGYKTVMALTVIDSNNFYMTSLKATQPASLDFRIVRVSDEVPSITWNGQISCPSANCYSSYSESDYTYDSQNTMYTLSAYNSNIIFISLILSETYNGDEYIYDYSSTLERYTTNTACNYGFFIKYHLMKVYMAFYCGSNMHLVIYDTDEVEFNVYMLASGIWVHDIDIEEDSGRVVIGGASQANQYWYSANFFDQAISVHPDFSTSTVSMAAVSSGSYTITTITSNTITGPNTYTWSDGTLTITDPTVSEIVGDQYESDIAYCLESVSIVAIELETTSKVIDMTYSVSGGNTVTFSLQPYGSGSVPSWVSFNSATGRITVTPDDVIIDTLYTFVLQASVPLDGIDYETLITVTVIDCVDASNVDGGGSGSGSSGGSSSGGDSSTDSSSGNGGSSGSGDTSTDDDSTDSDNTDSSSSLSQNSGVSVAAIKIVTTVLLVLTIVAAIIGIVSTKNYYQTCWIILDYVRLIVLLPACCGFSGDVMLFCAHFSYTLFSFSFTQFFVIFGLKDTVNSSKYQQSDAYLYEIGIESKSSFYNISNLFIIVGLLAIIHLVIKLIVNSVKPKGDSPKTCAKVLNAILKAFSYSVYIRIALESYSFMVLSFCAEIDAYETNSRNIVSLVLTCLMMTAYIGFTITALIMLIKKLNRSLTPDKYLTIAEIFRCLKDTKHVIIFWIFKMIRPWILALTAAMLGFMPTISRVTILVVFQSAYLTVACFVRPYTSRLDNIILITTETSLMASTSTLIYFNKADAWTGSFKWIYMCGVITTVLVCAVISVAVYLKPTIKTAKQSSSVTTKQNIEEALKQEDLNKANVSRVESNNSMLASNQLVDFESSNYTTPNKKRMPKFELTNMEGHDNRSRDMTDNYSFDFHPQRQETAFERESIK